MACWEVPHSSAGGPTPTDSLSTTAISPQIFLAEYYGREKTYKIVKGGVTTGKNFYFRFPFCALTFGIYILNA
jgi:hypothetical protein